MDDSFREELAALSLSRQPGVGAARFRDLLSRHGSPTAALAHCPPVRVAHRKSPTVEGLARSQHWLHGGGQLLYLNGPEYPTTLLDLGEPPPVLFLRGKREVFSDPCVALIGGRAAQEDTLKEARTLGERCARQGVVVVNGGARGVDRAALEGALSVGGKVIVVLGCGIDVVYPPEHLELFEQCAAHGTLVSELLPGAPPMQSFFVTRNRIIAALANTTVFVWGNSGSGALTTVRWAVRLKRHCGVLDQAGTQVNGALQEAIRRGAQRLKDRYDTEIWINENTIVNRDRS